jgi:hypothetical protein
MLIDCVWALKKSADSTAMSARCLDTLICPYLKPLTPLNIILTVRGAGLFSTQFVFKKKQSCPATRHGSAWGERRYSSYSFLTSALDGGEWSASRPGRALPPVKGTPGTHWTGGWVGPRAGLDAETRRKILCLCKGWTPVIQSIVSHYTDWATAAPQFVSNCV